MRTYFYLFFLCMVCVLATNNAPNKQQDDSLSIDSSDRDSLGEEDRQPSDSILAAVRRSDLFKNIGPYVPDGLRQFIFAANQEHKESNLEERQAVAPGGGIGPGASIPPTQMPSVITFELSGKVYPYTQTFPPTPVPWPAPTNGAVGLGTIRGQVGVVKTTAGA